MDVQNEQNGDTMPTRSDIQDGDQSIPNMDTQGSRPIRKRTLTAKGLKYRQEIAEVDFKSSIRLWRRQLPNLQSLMLTTLDFEELQRERGKFEARIEDVRDAHKRILDVLENEDSVLNISNEYDHCINESQKVIDRLDDKMAELQETRTRDYVQETLTPDHKCHIAAEAPGRRLIIMSLVENLIPPEVNRYGHYKNLIPEAQHFYPVRKEKWLLKPPDYKLNWNIMM